MSFPLDGYSFKARYLPTALAFMPVIILSTSFIHSTIIGILGGFISVCGVSVLLSQIGRDSGKRKEKELFKKWGGMPSVAILRHRDGTVISGTLERYHKRLEILVANTNAPSRDNEVQEPDKADAIYSTWSDFLRTNTRDKKAFPLIYNELVNYGFRRNLWGLKPIGLSLSVGVFLLLLAKLSAAWHFQSRRIWEVLHAEVQSTLLAGICLVIMIAWIAVVNQQWVHIVAKAYALRLVEASEKIDSKG